MKECVKKLEEMYGEDFTEDGQTVFVFNDMTIMIETESGEVKVNVVTNEPVFMGHAASDLCEEE